MDALIAHELGHILTVRGHGKTISQSELVVRNRVERYRSSRGRGGIVKELGSLAWDGYMEKPGQEWRETWAQAFSAWWIDKNTISAETREMVEDVLRGLYGRRLR
jgi:hypothetical protein